MKINKSGFTLIELLIVIALLGTLAVALLAAIDPFEQFKKATDTGVRNTSQELYNASIRYYAQRNGWPSNWSTGAVPSDGVGRAIGQSDTGGVVSGLTSAAELKQNFVQLAGDQLNKIYVARSGESKLMVCFSPQSNSFLHADRNVKFTSPNLVGGNPETDGSTTAGTCAVNGGTGPTSELCYWCLY